MSTETKVAAIPAVTEENLREVARAIKQILDVREGRAGDELDANVTFRDLVGAGLARLPSARGGGNGLPVVPLDPDGDVYDPTKDLTPPPAPTGFTALGLFAAIKLSWDNPPNTPNLAYTEIWRADTNALGQAVLIGTSTTTMYLDYVGTGQTRYYWARFVTQADITGPYNATEGTPGTAADDPAYLLAVLTGEITEDQLYNALRTRINLIDASDTVAGSVNNRIKTVNEIASLKNRTYVSNEPPSSQTNVLVLGDLWIDSNDSNKMYRWSGTAWVAIADARIGSLVTDLQSEVTNRIEGDLAEVRKTEALYAASFAGSGNNYKIFVQATEPVGTQIGDIWSWVARKDDGSSDVIFKRWSGLQWIDSATNKRAATYKGARSDAPLTDLVIGDMYFDIDDKKVYVWNSATWVEKTAQIPEVAAFVYSEQVARVDGDDALAQRVSVVAANKTRSYWQDEPPTGTTERPLVEGDIWFDTNDGNKMRRWSGTAWQDARDAGIALVDARVSDVETAKIGYATIKVGNPPVDVTFDNNGTIVDKAGVTAWNLANPTNPATWNVGLPLATAVKKVSVSDGVSTAALEQRFVAQKTTNDGLLAQYTLKVDNAGHVSGFGLASTTPGSTPFSEFGVLANRFFIAPPAFVSSVEPALNVRYKGYTWEDTSLTPSVTRYWTGTAWTTTPVSFPFIVKAGISKPGVYIDTAFIEDATITSAKIGSVFADTIQAGYTSSVDIEAGSFFGSELYLGGTVTYEYNFPGQATRKTGIASVANPNIALRDTGAEFAVSHFKIKSSANVATADTVFEVSNGITRIKQAYLRGLAVTDINGNVILGSGTALDWSNISGVGKPANNATRNVVYRQPNAPFSGMTTNDIWFDTDDNATYTFNGTSWVKTGDVTAQNQAASIVDQGTLAKADSVFVGSTVKFADGSTMNAGDFVNRLSKITTTNVGTFIDSAAITDAYIGNLNASKITAGTIAADRLDSGVITAKVANLTTAQIGVAQIDTLRIAGGAVTVPATANAFNQFNMNRWPIAQVLSNWQEALRITVDFGSVAPTAVLVCGIVNVLSQSGSNFTASYMRIRNETTNTALVDVGEAHGDSTVLTNLGSVSAVPGLNTFILEISQQDTGGTAWRAASRSLFVMGSKR
jgi:hypothetical protein